jgi:hypothetical protein
MITIDLSGPDGNAIVLMGYAKRLARKMGLDGDDIVAEMKSYDYDNLVTVFEYYFSDVVTLVH